jgi:hypothetical protein
MKHPGNSGDSCGAWLTAVISAIGIGRLYNVVSLAAQLLTQRP